MTFVTGVVSQKGEGSDAGGSVVPPSCSCGETGEADDLRKKVERKRDAGGVEGDGVTPRCLLCLEGSRKRHEEREEVRGWRRRS